MPWLTPSRWIIGKSTQRMRLAVSYQTGIKWHRPRPCDARGVPLRCSHPVSSNWRASRARTGKPMLAKLNTFALVGIEAVPVEVEVDASAGLPKTVLVGLPEMAIKESVHRIERALANLGYQRP